MKSLIEGLRFVARREAEEGEYNVEEHIDWMAADRLEQFENNLIHWNVAQSCWEDERKELEDEVAYLTRALDESRCDTDHYQQLLDEIIVALGSKGLSPNQVIPEIKRLKEALDNHERAYGEAMDSMANYAYRCQQLETQNKVLTESLEIEADAYDILAKQHDELEKDVSVARQSLYKVAGQRNDLLSKIKREQDKAKEEELSSLYDKDREMEELERKLEADFHPRITSEVIRGELAKNGKWVGSDGVPFSEEDNALLNSIFDIPNKDKH